MAEELRLARFLAEVRRRVRVGIAPEIDPLGIILARINVNPYTPQSRALAKAAIAVATTEGDMTEADLWALSQDALALLDAFAMRRLTNKYEREMLEAACNAIQQRIDLAAPS